MAVPAWVAERFWRVWTYRWHFEVAGQAYHARLECGWRTNVFTVAAGGQDLASDTLRFYQQDFGMQRLCIATPGGELTLETAPRNWYSYGLRVCRGGEVVYQSHSDPFAFLETARAVATFGTSDAGKMQGRKFREEVLPSLAVDVALGLLFYVAASTLSLRQAALIGAGVGLVLHGAQWVLDRLLPRKIDFTGGLSSFAILFLLLSAGLAWLIDSDLAIQLKSSVLGLIAAACLAVDAWLGGKYFGARVARYVSFIELDARRFSRNSALVAATLAIVDGAVALGLSRDAWLVYRSWFGPVLGLGLGLWALLLARKPPP